MWIEVLALRSPPAFLLSVPARRWRARASSFHDGLTRQSTSISFRLMALQKSWRWVGAFGPGLMLCAASARVGVLRRSWWAVWDGAQVHEGRRAPFALSLERGRSIEVTTGPAWTRKTPL